MQKKNELNKKVISCYIANQLNNETLNDFLINGFNINDKLVHGCSLIEIIFTKGNKNEIELIINMNQKINQINKYFDTRCLYDNIEHLEWLISILKSNSKYNIDDIIKSGFLFKIIRFHLFDLDKLDLLLNNLTILDDDIIKLLLKYKIFTKLKCKQLKNTKLILKYKRLNKLA